MVLASVKGVNGHVYTSDTNVPQLPSIFALT